MERRVEELLVALHSLQFSDASTIISELRQIVLSSKLTNAQIAFCSASLFNSPNSLLNFITKYRAESDRLIWKTLSNALNLFTDYVKAKSFALQDYIGDIRNLCMQLLATSTKSSMVKEAGIRALIKVLETFFPASIKDKIQPIELMEVLLDNKLRNEERAMGSNLRGCVYYTIGLILYHYPDELRDRIPELQDLFYFKLTQELEKGKGTEEKALDGMLKGMAYALTHFTYSEDVLNKLFKYAKALVKPIQGNRYTVPKAALMFINLNSQAFQHHILESARALCDNLLDLTQSRNVHLRENAQTCLEHCLQQICITLDSENRAHRNTFNHFLNYFMAQLDAEQTVIPAAVRSIGIMSPAIRLLHGSEILSNCLGKMVALSEKYIFEETEEAMDYKSLSYMQKQLASFIQAYTYMVDNIDYLDEAHVIHFSRLATHVFQVNTSLFQAKAELIYKVLAQFINAMARHDSIYNHWIRIVVKDGIVNILSFQEDLVMEARVYLCAQRMIRSMLQNDVLLEENKQLLADEIFYFYFTWVISLNLEYQIGLSEEIDYVNPMDFVLFQRATQLAGYIFPDLADRSSHWIMKVFGALSRKIADFPRLPVIYELMTSLMKICSKIGYFSFDVESKEIFMAFLKDIIKVYEQYQDLLLTRCVELLLSTPVELLSENITLWIPVIQKALQVGLAYVPMAHTAITALRNWIDKIELSRLDPHLESILPMLSAYLVVNLKQSETGPQEEEKKRKTVTHRAMKLLGSLGGRSHALVSAKSSNTHVVWDTEQKVKFPLPLAQLKMDILFDHMLPRVTYLAENSTHRQTKIAACEFLHAVITFTIGQSTSGAANFAKIYSHTFPVILRLASDIEGVSRTLFDQLSKQLVRWFARSREYEHPEVMALFDALIDAVSSPGNSALRHLASSCIGEFSRWLVKSHNELPIHHFKSLIRRVNNNAYSNDIYKRLGAILCYQQILPTVMYNDALLDRFFLEIAHFLFKASRRVHYDSTYSVEIEKIYKDAFAEIERVIMNKPEPLQIQNPKRAHHVDLAHFVGWIWELCVIPEDLCRQQAQRIWELARTKLPYDESYWTNKLTAWNAYDPNYVNSYIASLQYILWRQRYNDPQIIQNVKTFLSDPGPLSTRDMLRGMNVTLRYKPGFFKELDLVRIILTPESMNLVSQIETPTTNEMLDELREAAEKELQGRMITEEILEEIKQIMPTAFDQGERLLQIMVRGYSHLANILGRQAFNHIFPTIENIVITAFESNEKAQHGRGQILLKFLIIFELSNTFMLQLVSRAIFFQLSQEVILDYLAKRWEQTCNVIFGNLAENPEIFFQVLVPIIENAKALVVTGHVPSQYYIDTFCQAVLTYIPPFISAVPSQNLIILLMKVLKVFIDSVHWIENQNILANGLRILESNADFLACISDLIQMFLHIDRSVAIKKEAIELLGLCWNLSSGQFYKKFLPTLEEIRGKHFPISTESLSSGKETSDFEILFKAFLSLISKTGHVDCVRQLYPILKEEKSAYDLDINRALKQYISNYLTNKPTDEIQNAFDLFLDDMLSEKYREHKHNIRWAVAKKILLPIIDNCDLVSVEALLTSQTKKVLAILKSKNFNNCVDATQYILLLREKAMILLIFERFYDKIPTERIKTGVHQAIYGPSCAGNELTKELISFTSKFKSDKPERYELVEGVDIGPNAIRGFISAAFACMCTVIRKTQTLEKNFVNFVFQSFSGVKWRLITEDVETYNFRPDTSFKVERFTSRDDVKKEESEVRKKNNVFAEYLANSLFSYSQANPSAALKRPQRVPTPEPEMAEESIDLELDEINSHICMRPLLAVIDTMVELFETTWHDMPQWMQLLHGDLGHPSSSLAVRTLIIKIIINRPKVFEPWAEAWLEPLITAMTSPNGGIGFHYFIRDVATLFAYTWQYQPNNKKQVCSKFVNYLVRVGADENKSIFVSNLEIIGALMNKWKHNLQIEHRYVEGMMNKTELTWKINGIQVYSLWLQHGIPILQNGEEKTAILHRSLIACLEYTKRLIILGASEVVGILLQSNEEIADQVENYFVKKDIKDMGMAVLVLDKVTMNYPKLLDRTSIAMKLGALFPSMSGITRSALLKATMRYFRYVKTAPSYGNVSDLAEFLFRDRSKIVNDSEESHRMALMELLNEAASLHSNASILKMMGGYLPMIRFFAGESESIRRMYYSMLRVIYDEANRTKNNELLDHSRSGLIKGFADESSEIRAECDEFWHARLSQDPLVRVNEVLNQLYTQEDEALWLLAAPFLVMKLSENSADFARLLFDQPLSECEFKEMEFKDPFNATFSSTPNFAPKPTFESSQSNVLSSFVDSFAVPRAPTQRNRIRYRPEGVLETQEERYKQMIYDRTMKRAQEQRQRSVNVLRKYRVGELPDVQINYSDFILPLLSLLKLDLETATNIWVALFISLYKLEKKKRTRDMAIQTINLIFENSKKYTPSLISCLHRSACEVIKIDGAKSALLEPQSICKSAIMSMSYQSGIILLEECILHREASEGSHKRRKQNTISGSEDPQVEEKNTWICLAKVHDKLGDIDTVKGLWRKISTDQVRQAFDQQSRGDYTTALEQFQQSLEAEQDPEVGEEIRKQSVVCMEHLGDWGAIQQEPEIDLNLKIKSYLRQDNFTELNELMKEQHSDDLFIKYSYPMALLSIVWGDTDRARYYLEEEYNHFLENWSSLNQYSTSARHKLISNLQKINEFSEYLKISAAKKDEPMEEYLHRVEECCNRWRSRFPSYNFDDLNVWDDIQYARVMFYNSLQNKYSLNIREYKSILMAQTAKFPLKLGMIDVAEKYLRDAMQNRQDRNTSDISLFSSVLKLKTQQAEKHAYVMSLAQVHDQAKKIIKTASASQAYDQNDIALLKADISRAFTQIYLSKNDFKSQKFIESICFVGKIAYENYKEVIKSQPKAHMRFANFCDMLLRANEMSDEEGQMAMGAAFNQMQVQPHFLARNIVTSGIAALEMGVRKAHDLFPRLLELLKYQITGNSFNLENVPTWMLIRWISQILAIIDTPESKLLEPAIKDLLAKYPQFVYYPYKCFMSVESPLHFAKMTGRKTRCWKICERYYGENLSHLENFVLALENLTHPEHRLKYWMEVLKESKRDPDFVEFCVQQIWSSIFDTNEISGAYNRKFAQDITKEFVRNFGKEGRKIISQTTKDFTDRTDQFLRKISATGHGPEKLNAFSEWLSDYDIIDHPMAHIEIPGQYTGMQEPVEQHIVKISSFNQSILILNSIRRPKRISIHGTDEKEYFILVKGGEDLRLDQRIQQLFSLMNEIFSKDVACSKEGIHIKTFQVTPINKRLGMLEWVPNTEPIKAMLNRELERHYGIDDITRTDANHHRVQWLSAVASNANSISEQHVMILGQDARTIQNNFNKHTKMIPWDLARQGLLSLTSSPEGFLHVRTRFIKSLAAISVCCYILGIGDRHLENYLVDTTDGELLAIDFGVAFGSGISLGVPELMPFRLTRQLTSVLAPEGIDGQLRHVMIHCLSALRKNRNLILDCCEVFIKEPLLDWVKTAQKSQPTVIDSLASQAEGIAWYPKKKVDICRKKLEGWNSAHIMIEELQETKHRNNKSYYNEIITAVLGPEQCMRRRAAQSGLTADLQVDVLIEHATDPNILGRTWIGWLPYV